MQMKKLCLCGVFITAFSAHLFAQPLFTYGNKKVDKNEFLNAFLKNPPDSNSRTKALNDYLDLYINYKLKVQAAYDEKLDTNASFQIESINFKKQIAESFINEEANEKTLLNEAFARSKKDIELAQIFVAFGTDSAAALKKIQTAFTQLKSGKNFNEAVQQFSTDEASKKNNGSLGFVTVFTLPYEIENEVYQLKPGAFSMPYKSRYGYHIFKNVKERTALGKRKIAQILLSFPPNASEDDKKKIAESANNIYGQIQDGKAFDQLAKQFSTDKNSAPNGGVLPEISIGQYSPDFEEKVFALQQINEVSKPFVTGYGYHIVQLLGINGSAKNSDDATLKQQVETGDRLLIAKKNLTKKWLQLTAYKKALYDEKELLQYTDSAVHNRSVISFKKIKDSTIIFSFAKQKIYAADFIKYAKHKSSEKNYSEQLKDFTNQQCSDYYVLHLDEYNQNMKKQLHEFNEANLLFTAMEKYVWNKAGQDSFGLKKYFQNNAAKYTWSPGIAAIIVTAGNKETANEVANKLQQKPTEWRSITSSYGASVSADSGRYENNQLALQQKIENKKGFISAPEKSAADDSYFFVFVTDIFPTATQRNFDEAKGMVINDYQLFLEQKWLAELKKKYPVKVNDAVWKTVK